MAPHASHAQQVGATAGGLWHGHHRDWRRVVRDKAHFVWVPIWLATAVGITFLVVELVTKGFPVISIG